MKAKTNVKAGDCVPDMVDLGFTYYYIAGPGD
jgi:hypothetical protein